MELRRLYKTIENLATQNFHNEAELLESMLKEIVRNEEIPVKGGRVWKFEPRSAGYVLLHQLGDIEKIKRRYKLDVDEYPMFLELPKRRTMLANETDAYLRDRGITTYSATGVGEKVRWNNHLLYQYILAVNSDFMDENLGYTLGIIGSALTAALKSASIERKATILESDLDKAREIQRSILPEHEVRFHNYEIYGVSIPARIVGGDFFDYLQGAEDSDRFAVVIGDAVSKGLSAAAQALYVSGALRMGAEFQTKISTLITKTNKLMHRTFPDENFVTLFYGELVKDTKGLLIYANAGHNSPILVHNDCSIEYLGPTGQMLGPFLGETYGTESAHMKKGDILLLYTDGVTEAMNESGEFFGEQRLAELLCTYQRQSAKEITQVLLEEVEKFSVRNDQSDDMTLVVIRRTQ